MRMCIYIVILILISCQEYKKQKNDDRYIVFNLYIWKNLASHSITLDFKDKSVFVHNIINEANFDRFVEDEVEVVEGTLPAPDQYVYMSFNYFKGNKCMYYCFNPTGKEWDIFYLVRDFNMKNDTINRDKWVSFFNIGKSK